MSSKVKTKQANEFARIFNDLSLLITKLQMNLSEITNERRQAKEAALNVVVNKGDNARTIKSLEIRDDLQTYVTKKTLKGKRPTRVKPIPEVATSPGTGLEMRTIYNE